MRIINQRFESSLDSILYSENKLKQYFSEFRKANAGNFNIREMSHLDEVIKEHYVPRTELNKL